MKRLLAVLFVLLSPNLYALDLSERQIVLKRTEEKKLLRYEWGQPVYETKPVYVASLASVKFFAPPPVLFQYIPPSGGGGSSGITIDTTAITGGADCNVLYNNAAVVGNDANLCWTDTANAAFLTVGSGTGAGTIKFLEGSAGGTDAISLTVPASFGAAATVTLPTTTTTLAGLASSPLFSSNMGSTARYYIGGIAGTNNSLGLNTTLTPDAGVAYTGTLSESWHFFQDGDSGFDFNNGRCLTSACTNPSVIVHSPDQVTTEYAQIQADATGAAHYQSNLAEIVVGASKANITEGAGQVIVRITMPSSAVFAGWISYLVSDGDGTDFVGRGGTIQIQGANKAGTSVCTINTSRDTEAEDGSQIVNAAAAFTLTYTWTNVVNTTSCDLTLNGASSAGTNTYDITYTVHLNGTSNAITVNPQ